MRLAPDIVGGGAIRDTGVPASIWNDRALTNIGDKLRGYPETDLQAAPSLVMQNYSSSSDPNVKTGKLTEGKAIALTAGNYRILDFGLNDTGFIGANVTCTVPTTLVFAFDEILTKHDVDFKRLGCVNLIQYALPAGSFDLETFEPYTFRYLKPIVISGYCQVSNLYIREYACPGVSAAGFHSSDPRLEKLFNAGRETFRQNAVDVFTDCPSRERGGWLCDSFFTARVAPDLTGNTAIESVQMEDFLLPRKFEFLPVGMLPMTYPADHNDGVFIPNWALWFILQTEEYLSRSGDRKTVDGLKDRVLGVFDYLKTYRNSDGLLEKLPGWVFIEWSDANKYVQDVNYPSNMLYAGALAAAGRLYNRADLTAEADRIRDVIRKQSFDGDFFVDNAVRKPDRKLEVTRNRTEVCQYYAFYFGVATPTTHSKLWVRLRDEFGPKRMEKKLYADIGVANSLTGNMVRTELLSREGLSQQILDESIDYLLNMADRTGTLWENVGDYASCNHAFASHIVHTLYRDVLGIRRIDRVRKKITLRFSPLNLEWCNGRIPTPEGPIMISWKKRGNQLMYSCNTPKGYTVATENPLGLNIQRAAGSPIQRVSVYNSSINAEGQDGNVHTTSIQGIVVSANRHHRRFRNNTGERSLGRHLRPDL